MFKYLLCVEQYTIVELSGYYHVSLNSYVRLIIMHEKMGIIGQLNGQNIISKTI